MITDEDIFTDLFSLSHSLFHFSCIHHLSQTRMNFFVTDSCILYIAHQKPVTITTHLVNKWNLPYFSE